MQEKKMTYLQDRAGRIHVWDEETPNDKDPWQRAVCGSPADFWELLEYKGPVTCRSCMKELGMARQLPLFGKDQ